MGDLSVLNSMDSIFDLFIFVTFNVVKLMVNASLPRS